MFSIYISVVTGEAPKHHVKDEASYKAAKKFVEYMSKGTVTIQGMKLTMKDSRIVVKEGGQS
jgi:hypothetical protein